MQMAEYKTGIIKPRSKEITRLLIPLPMLSYNDTIIKLKPEGINPIQIILKAFDPLIITF